MSIVLDALKKTSASEKTASSTPKTPGDPPSRGSLFGCRRFPLAGFIGLLIAGFGILLWVLLPSNPDPPGRDEIQLKADGPDSPQDEALAVLHAEGAELLHAGDYAGALARFSEIVSRRPDSPQGHNNLGLVFKKMGNKGKASEQYRRALALDPDHVEAMNNLAVLYGEEGKGGEAEPLFLQALSKDPDYAEAHLNYALFLERTGRGGDSRPHYQAYINLVPPEDPAARRVREHLR